MLSPENQYPTSPDASAILSPCRCASSAIMPCRVVVVCLAANVVPRVCFVRLACLPPTQHGRSNGSACRASPYLPASPCRHGCVKNPRDFSHFTSPRQRPLALVAQQVAVAPSARATRGSHESLFPGRGKRIAGTRRTKPATRLLPMGVWLSAAPAPAPPAPPAISSLCSATFLHPGMLRAGAYTAASRALDLEMSYSDRYRLAEAEHAHFTGHALLPRRSLAKCVPNA
ncbi:uncharacterized protein K452DRAFT_126594 [Aplosporella prunicola CBS 121167]|uniref:Uncharacterized protein n=1 Tax=Aplosporella prunicola CBS 121167 TaxID=1176127 RepID=A0A6A6AXP9_9PEZI|nr:uncharacterized protein K452DRAFT_126594 [Aplosporella prunicola CBS 121167]KAF2136719.1 hypothetical protein K452DRAFT_126594 [Aplosporella prunicola CBS 121167]